jgi:four helix bundle protein
MGSHKDLFAFQKGYALAMEIFTITRRFPPEEKYSLTDQIRRSSRSVCVNIDEGYRKRRYKAHFISKLTDADMENTETGIWLNFAKDCKYITEEEFESLSAKNTEVGRLIGSMLQHLDKFL